MNRWTRADFMVGVRPVGIKRGSSTDEVEYKSGLVNWPFAIDEYRSFVNNYYTLSHIPSGRVVATRPTIAELKKLAKRLRSLRVMWHRSKPLEGISASLLSKIKEMAKAEETK